MANINRTKNSSRTFAFGLLGKIVSIVGPFLTRTIVIHKLGAGYLGLSSLFTSVLSILNVSELGIGAAITYCLYKPIADQDNDSIRSLLSFLRKIYKWIGLFILSVGCALLPILPKLIKGGYPPDINIYLLYLIYLLNASVSYLGFAYKNVLLTAYQRGDINYKNQLIGELIRYCIQIPLLVISGNYYLFVLVLPIITMVVNILTQKRSISLYPDLYPNGEVDRETKRVIKKKVIYLSAHSLAATLTNTVDNIVISSSIGLVTTAIYGNYSYISSAILSIIIIAYNSLTPVIGNSMHSETKEKNIVIFKALLFICSWVIMFSAICLHLLYQPFMTLWLGAEYLLDDKVMIMIVAYFYVNALRQFFGTYVSAAGLWNKTLPRQIIMAVSNLVLDIILVGKFGILGIVFASMITTLLVSLPMDIYVTYKYILGTDFFDGFKKLFINIFLTICVGSIAHCLGKMYCGNLLIEFCLKAVIGVLFPNLIMILLYRKTTEYKFLLEHLKSIIKRNK